MVTRLEECWLTAHVLCECLLQFLDCSAFCPNPSRLQSSLLPARTYSCVSQTQSADTCGALPHARSRGWRGSEQAGCLLLSCFPPEWRPRDPGLSTAGERKCGLHEAERGQEPPQREDCGGLSWVYSFPRAAVTNTTD